MTSAVASPLSSDHQSGGVSYNFPAMSGHCCPTRRQVRRQMNEDGMTITPYRSHKIAIMGICQVKPIINDLSVGVLKKSCCKTLFHRCFSSCRTSPALNTRPPPSPTPRPSVILPDEIDARQHPPVLRRRVDKPTPSGASRLTTPTPRLASSLEPRASSRVALTSRFITSLIYLRVTKTVFGGEV